MSTRVIGVFDGGSTTINDNKGRSINVGVFVFRTVTNEAAPVDVVAFCNPIYKDSIKKSLSRLQWIKPYASPAATDEEMVKVHHKPESPANSACAGVPAGELPEGENADLATGPACSGPVRI